MGTQPLLIIIVILLAIIFQQHIATLSTETMATSTNKKYAQDGDEAKEIAEYLPYFPFKGIPRFYDIGAFLYGTFQGTPLFRIFFTLSLT